MRDSRMISSSRMPGAEHEHQPALELVEEPFRHADAEAFDQQPDAADAQAVHDDGNRDARGEHDRAFPQRRAIEIRHDERQRDQREQVAQSIAGGGHFELVLRPGRSRCHRG